MRHIESQEEYDSIVTDVAETFPEYPAGELATALVAYYNEKLGVWSSVVDLGGDGPITETDQVYDDPLCPSSVLQWTPTTNKDGAYDALVLDIKMAQAGAYHE